MNQVIDGPVSSNFKALAVAGNLDPQEAEGMDSLSDGLRQALKNAPTGSCVELV